MSYDQKHVNIPWPRTTQNVYRGKNNPPEEKMFPIAIRMTESDRDAIDKCAASIGLTRSEFIRWCSFYAAIEINNAVVMGTYSAPAQPDHQKSKVDLSDYE